jgi:hypothetical protein
MHQFTYLLEQKYWQIKDQFTYWSMSFKNNFQFFSGSKRLPLLTEIGKMQRVYLN